jgi:hypothetical protein
LIHPPVDMFTVGQRRCFLAVLHSLIVGIEWYGLHLLT